MNVKVTASTMRHLHIHFRPITGWKMTLMIISDVQDFMDTPHVGHPDLWQFEPIIPKWITNDEQFY